MTADFLAATATSLPALFAYQAQVIARVIKRGRHTFIGLEQGLGKSRIALEIAQRRHLRRIVVLGAAVGRVVWPDEVACWLPVGTYKVYAAMLPDQVQASPAHVYTIVFIAYDSLSRRPAGWIPAIARFKPDLIVLDEAHRLGHIESIRASTVYGRRSDSRDGIVHLSDLVLPMSGTPARNNLAELYPVLRALAPETIQHPSGHRPLEFYEFVERFCTTKPTQWGNQITGSRNISELRQRMADFMIRMRARDVLKQLPAIRYVTTPLALSSRHMNLPVDEVRLSAIPDDELLSWLQMQPLATARREIGLRKAPAIAEWARSWLDDAEPQDKLVIFARHPVVLHAIQQDLASTTGVVLIDGATPTPARADAVHRFQHDAEVRLFLGQIEAAGEMITLTRASTVVIAECEFTPALVSQAAKRAHRIGQIRPVLVHLLVTPGTLDQRIARICARKASELSEMFDALGASAA